MSTSIAMDHPSILSDAGDSNSSNDPFLSPPSAMSGHRFSHFDKQLFALGPSTSPEQAKRALEAHLAETERRIQEASNLGTTLLQQRKDLGERLKEVEKQQSEGDITPELRQKLVDIEKEYNEVGRETARAFLPKSRVSSNEMGGSPLSDKRSASPSKFESQATATASPSKFSVPNRKQRNQPANRVHDIEFATEISTSLLAQVRHLQALLAEKEETLKTVALEKSRLELEAEGFTQRLRSLDESENRYKDENWNLETQIHEHLATQKEASEREKRLTQSLSLLQAEKGAAQKELDEIRLNHAKLQDQHASAVKHLDVELGTAKRSLTIFETEKLALQKKVEELIGQNQELARAVAHHRSRVEEREASQGSGEEEPPTTTDNNTPEHSPPPSPVKMTPRHSMLESETLKSSLHHAHRMIQNLKGNIHREKTEKLELKRMLQEARDEIEVARRGEPQVDSPGPRRSRKNTPISVKKPFKVGQLGGIRNSRSEVLIEEDQQDHLEDVNWEDDHEQPSPSRGSRAMGTATGAAVAASMAAGVVRSSNQLFGSSTEQSDAFETANERNTETEDFQTGVEDMTGADDTDTETEKGGTVRAKPSRGSIALSKAGNRDSFQSTASTSDDEYLYEDAKTPGIHPQRLRLKVSRNGNRRSRVPSEDAQADSPIDFVDISKETPQPARQSLSLFAELGELASDDESVASGTQSRYASRGNTPQSSRPSTARNVPASATVPPVPRIPMTDSATMTEPWEPEPHTQTTTAPILSGLAGAALGAAGGVAAALGFNAAGHDPAVSPEPEAEPQILETPVDTATREPLVKETQAAISLPYIEPQASDVAPESEATTFASAEEAQHVSPQVLGRPPMSEAASQWHDEQMKQQMDGLLKVQPQHDVTRPVSTTYSDMSSQYDNELIDEKLDRFPSPPISRTNTSTTNLAAAETTPVVPLTISTIRSEHIEAEPIPEVEPTPAAPLTISTIHSEQIEQVDADPVPVEPLSISAIRSEHVEPMVIEEGRSESLVLPAILPSTPKHASGPDYFSVSPGLGFSTIQSVDTEPIAPSTPRSPKRDGVLLSRFPVTESKSVNEDKSVEARSPTTESRSVDEVKPEQGIKAKEEPHTPKTGFMNSVFGGWNKKQPGTPIIAEDETSQSPGQSPVAETPESQRPFKVVSGNATESSPKKPRVEMADESSQTALTAEQIDQMLNKGKRQEAVIAQDGQKSPIHSQPHSNNIPAALKVRKSQESIGSISRSKPKSSDLESPADVTPKRPTSSGSGRNASISSIHPPLPSDHRQVIAAAAQRAGSAGGSGDHKNLDTLTEDEQDRQQPQRTGSSTSAGTGAMGPPPPLPSTSKSRPKTPSSQTHGSSRVTSTSKYRNPSTERDVQSPPGTGRSRHSSVSSFASEVDTRFNLRAGIPMPQGVESSTDPRMINAITQTMIGEYLWKYTRKAGGRGGMSENRHRRYFWVHPYTRTLYWSDRDPSTAGRSELKAKSVAIEAVRVVTDDNPMPPGLHRKSLVILTPGRTVQFTASTGQRHETWFNALSYLLLRTGEDAVADTVEVSGALTSEDVNEFNPGYGHAHLGSRRGPASLSSYNSRTTRNDSPISKDRRYSTMHPRLTSRPSRPALGSNTFSRLSSYFLPVDGNKTFSGRRSRSVNGAASSIYEASEVHDSAEDMREQIERQDRESDRLENVRACCDGKHDVGHLHHDIPKGRQTISAASGSYRQTHRAPSRTSQRPSEPSQQT